LPTFDLVDGVIGFGGGMGGYEPYELSRAVVK